MNEHPAVRSILDEFESGKLSAQEFQKRLGTLGIEDLAWVTGESIRRARDQAHSLTKNVLALKQSAGA